MNKPSSITRIIVHPAKIILLAITFAFGLVASRIVLATFGVIVPRFPQQAGESEAIYYLLGGSLLLAVGFYPLFRLVQAGMWARLVYLFFFIFVAFAVGVTIESSIYSDTVGYGTMTWVLLFPVALFSVVGVLLTQNPVNRQPAAISVFKYFGEQTGIFWSWRLLLAVLAFPVVYFLFGIAVSPVVTPYYETLVAGLHLPDPVTIVGVQFFRSILFMLVTLPLLVNWAGTKTQLIAALGTAHFVMVFGYDIVLAIKMPWQLVLIHGLEILLDSFVYAWIFVGLLWRK